MSKGVCRYFKGDRPCKYYWDDRSYECEKCEHHSAVKERILIIKLDAIGDVIRATPLAAGLKKKHPHSFITWLVGEESYDLLKNNPYIDRLVRYSHGNVHALMVQRFDLLINLDKDSNAASLAVSLKAKIRQGYGLDENGVVFPLNKAARYHFDICLENWGKKTANRKSYQEMIFDIAGLKFAGEEYYINMPDSTKGIASRFKRNHSIKPTDIVVGLNTGCGPVYPHKKWVPDNYSKLIVRLVKELDAKVVLFGSKSEMEYNADIIVGASKLKEKVKSNVIDVTGLTSILGLASLINVCDVLVTGDTAGMHIAIGLRRPVVALFGPTPAQEINLYGRGVKLVGEVDCINCYDQFPCDKKPNCMETISPDEVFKAVSSLVDR